MGLRAFQGGQAVPYIDQAEQKSAPKSFEQLRMALPITLAHPPAEFVLTPPGCTAAEPCSFAVFDHAAHALLDPAYVKADLLPTESAKPTP